MTIEDIPDGTPNWGPLVNGNFDDLQDQQVAHEEGADPHGDRAWAELNFQKTTDITVDELISANPFFVAHRGSGSEYPEMTMVAYDSVVAAGATSIEVSCHLSADGVLFAFHDNDLTRMTNGTWTTNPELWTYAALKERALIVGTPLLGPGWANQPIPTVKEIFDRWLGKVVIWAEAKSNAATVPLQNLLLSYPNANESVVWKNYYQNLSFAWAKNNGFKTWGYVDVGTTMGQMDAVEANIDMWGVPIEAPNSQFTAVLTRPQVKPVMSWEVHRRSEVTRLTGLGVRGMMCSEWVYCTRTTPVLAADQWVTQVKAPGEIGAAHSDPTFALKWDTVVGANVVYNPKATGDGIELGEFSPTAASGYAINFDMYWPVLPVGTLHAGIYFAETDDTKHKFNDTGNAAMCYRFEIRPNSGVMQLYTVTPGVAAGTQIGADVPTSGALSAATWYSYRAEVTATTVTLKRTDGAGWSGLFTDSFVRGFYLGIHNGSLTDTATIPRYRNFSITAL